MTDEPDQQNDEVLSGLYKNRFPANNIVSDQTIPLSNKLKVSGGLSLRRRGNFTVLAGRLDIDANGQPVIDKDIMVTLCDIFGFPLADTDENAAKGTNNLVTHAVFTVLNVAADNFVWDRTAADWEAQYDGNVTSTKAGATPQTILAAAGATKKYRIFKLNIGSDTAGLVTLKEHTAGTVLAQSYVPANGNAPFDFGNGLLQPDANDALDITSSAGNVAATITTDGGA